MICTLILFILNIVTRDATNYPVPFKYLSHNNIISIDRENNFHTLCADHTSDRTRGCQLVNNLFHKLAALPRKVHNRYNYRPLNMI